MKLVMVEHQMLRAMDTNVSFVFKMELKKWIPNACVLMHMKLRLA